MSTAQIRHTPSRNEPTKTAAFAAILVDNLCGAPGAIRTPDPQIRRLGGLHAHKSVSAVTTSFAPPARIENSAKEPFRHLQRHKSATPRRSCVSSALVARAYREVRR